MRSRGEVPGLSHVERTPSRSTTPDARLPLHQREALTLRSMAWYTGMLSTCGHGVWSRRA